MNSLNLRSIFPQTLLSASITIPTYKILLSYNHYNTTITQLHLTLTCPVTLSTLLHIFFIYATKRTIENFINVYVPKLVLF